MRKAPWPIAGSYDNGAKTPPKFVSTQDAQPKDPKLVQAEQRILETPRAAGARGVARTCTAQVAPTAQPDRSRSRGAIHRSLTMTKGDGSRAHQEEAMRVAGNGPTLRRLPRQRMGCPRTRRPAAVRVPRTRRSTGRVELDHDPPQAGCLPTCVRRVRPGEGGALQPAQGRLTPQRRWDRAQPSQDPSAIKNAEAFLAVQEEFDSFDAYRWRPHTFRHARATSLLRRGVSLKVIGDVLGHRVPEATAIYCKLAWTICGRSP